MRYTLEICCDSLCSALIAMKAGADRIELCNNLAEGGTTPSYGIIARTRELLKIRLNVLIRPRGGDFLYDDHEFEIMMRDIGLCKSLGADGVVLGILNSDGTVDVRRTSELVNAARPLQVTFHRAFDMSNEPFKALENIISCGAERLLTSGQKNRAIEGTSLIAELVKLAGERLIVMAGSGLNDSNIEAVARLTGAKEYHLTGRKSIVSEMIFRAAGISMGGIAGMPEYSRKTADHEMIGKIRSILDNI